MIENKLRIGNFTSSEIVALTTKGTAKDSKGKPFYSYIEEKKMERRLGRSVDSESNAKPLQWGRLLEQFAFEKIGTEYIISSQETDSHPTIKCWSGSKDGIKYDEGKTIFDIKAPMTLKSFCQLVDCKTMDELRNNHKDGDKYFWQLVSNAIINDCKFAELIVYVPYEKDLDEIKKLAENQCNWVFYADKNELPYLIEGGHYKDINIIRFEVSQSDKDFLTNRVLEAELLLTV